MGWERRDHVTIRLRQSPTQERRCLFQIRAVGSQCVSGCTCLCHEHFQKAFNQIGIIGHIVQE